MALKYCMYTNISVIATDKNGVISVSKSQQVIIEEPNFPDLLNCDLVARLGSDCVYLT